MLTLRPYQTTGVHDLRAALRHHRAALYVLPTGGGKTVVFSYIANSAAARGNRITICVHRRELLRQTCRMLDFIGLRHGVISPGEPRHYELPVQVATVQTLVRRDVPEPKLIIFDEAHHVVSETWAKIRASYQNAAILGVTATPCRLDGRGLGTAFDTMVTGPSMRELVAGDYLTPAEVWAPGTVDLTGVRTRAGDYARDDLAAALDRKAIVGDVVEHYGRILQGAPSMCFCASVAHAEHVAEAFRAEGYRAESVDGKLDQATRDARIAALGTGDLNVLTSCDLISEGVDIPVVTGAILLRPTKSLGLYMQQVGRCLRPAPGKTNAVILDHVGNVLRHGMPNQVREWTLEHGVPKPKETDPDAPDIRRCDECYAVHEYAPACPYCGYVYPVKERKIKQEAGELRQLTEDEIQALEDRAKKTGRLADWHAVGKAKGYKPGWAFYKCKQARANRTIRRAAI